MTQELCCWYFGAAIQIGSSEFILISFYLKEKKMQSLSDIEKFYAATFVLNALSAKFEIKMN